MERNKSENALQSDSPSSSQNPLQLLKSHICYNAYQDTGLTCLYCVFIHSWSSRGLWTSCASFSFVLHLPSYDPVFLLITMPKFGASFQPFQSLPIIYLSNLASSINSALLLDAPINIVWLRKNAKLSQKCTCRLKKDNDILRKWDGNWGFHALHEKKSDEDWRKKLKSHHVKKASVPKSQF